MENIELLEPEKLYKNELKAKHHENVEKAFEELTKKSGVSTEENGITCKKYYEAQNAVEALNKKIKRLGFLKVLFIFLCFLIIGIFLLIFVYKPRKKALMEELAKAEDKAKEFYNEACAQMAPLNALFESSIPARLMEKTAPLIDFDRVFDVKKYELMKEKYGFWDNSDESTSTLDLQSGTILGNPFVIFKDMKRTMIQQEYVGSITISWTVRSGNQTYVRTETLTATIKKPKPVFSKETYLVYCNEAGDRLSFSRTPSNINDYDEKELVKYVMKHEKDLTKLAEKAMKKGGSYTPLGNSEFELFFGGLDRDNEVQYRLLMTPLAQKSLLDLLKSKEGYGDDFIFIKTKGVNVIQSAHSQGTTLFVNVNDFKGFDYQVMKDFFINYNDAYFKALFFDFAPLLSIPLYQQYKTHDYIYKNNVGSNFNCFVHETLANKCGHKRFDHPDAQTDSILKTQLLTKADGSDVVNVTSYSFRTQKRIENVTKLGGDGKFHTIPVTWIEYVPISNTGTIAVSDLGMDDEIKFRGLGTNNVIYANGLVASDTNLNVDINNLKSLMKKD